MTPLAIVTIVSNNYLHFARTLMQSVARHHPEAQRYCVIVDRDMSHAQALGDEFLALDLDTLKLPDGDDFLFQYTILELNTAVKPWALQYLMAQGHQRVVYIDPDIVLYRPLSEALALLDGGGEIVFTPHLLAPVSDALQPSELDIRRAGTYNLGFCALGASAETRSFLIWWQGKLRRDCIVAHDRGIFVDQSWMDLVPGLFPRVCVLRHPGYNVAYWNLAQRPLVRNGDTVLVGGEPLAFFHYSGLDPSAPQPVSKHQNRFTLDTLPGVAAELIKEYCRRIEANGMAYYKVIAYGFGRYDDGTAISNADRSRYRVNEQLRALAAGRPFRHRNLVAIDDPVVESAKSVSSAPYLDAVYAHLLDRAPDDQALDHYQRRTQGARRHLRILLAVALSGEARSRPGWFQRLLSWPLRGALFKARPIDVSHRASAAQPPDFPLRPSPYGGLSAPEPDSAQSGIWVGPRLHLPTCECATGRLQIRGFVDLGLLQRGGAGLAQRLDIHGPFGLLHSETLAHGGAFCIDLRIDPAVFIGASQWVILASAHVVPKDIGLGEDSRQLAWRVQCISVDDHVLVDCARSPVTLPITQLCPANGVNLIGYVSAELGLGEAARSLANACVAGGIPFSAIDVGFQSSNLQRDTRVATQAVDRHFPIDLIYVNADQTAATAAYLDRKHYRGLYRIGFWHWEQPRLPDSVLGAFSHVDEVWVPSTFVHDAVAPFSPVPVVKIPHALEFSPSPGVSRNQFGLPRDKLLALVMYDFHSYQYRKNPQAALAAFRLAAKGSREVALVIKTINSQHHPEARAELRERVADLPNVIFFDDFMTRQQTWDLQSCCDLLISLHRAEGFGLAPAEMMHLGKPVVATGWSANMDFMNAENSFPVRYQLRPLTCPVGVYPAGQNWAEADVDHAADCLARLIESPELRQRIGQQAARDIRRQLSPRAVGALVSERLSLLGFWHPELRA